MGADDFTISGSLNQALFGFGDAVCVPVIEWIAQNYLNLALEGHEAYGNRFEHLAYA
jgi:DNA (cytosine-5)-methyltransferase 1